MRSILAWFMAGVISISSIDFNMAVINRDEAVVCLLM